MGKMKWIKEFVPLDNNSVLESVLRTADWIKEYEHRTYKGVYYDVLPEKDVPKNAILLDRTSFYGGSAGIALFFLRLYIVTGERKWLEEAVSALNYIIADYKGKSIYEDVRTGTETGINTGFLNGPAGGAYVAELLYQITKEKTYREYAVRVTDDLIASAKSIGRGITWSEGFGIIADGGLVLYLAYIYWATGDDRYLEAAKRAAYYIADKAEDAPQGGLRWYAMDTVAFGLGEKGYFPGFFYGAAGSAYILAVLYELTGENEFLDKAKLGAAYVANIADEKPEAQAALVRYNDPYRPDLYYLGMCQGPIGTSRLFYKLYEITKEATYMDWIIKLTNGILEAGAPKLHSGGYWHTYCYCCGAGGMAEHFLHIYDLTGNQKYLHAARESVEVLMRDSYADEKGLRWYTTWNRHLPNEVEAFTGLYHGSAGCASALLTYYNHETIKKELPGYLEDPYNNKER